MNIIFNPLLSSEIYKEDFDNKTLYVFIIFMGFMMLVGLFYINLTADLQKNSSTIDNSQIFSQKIRFA